MNRVSAPVAPPSWTTARRLATSKYSSNLTWSWPPSSSPNSLNNNFQVHPQTHSITASKCISKLARSQPPMVSQNLHNYAIQVHLQTRPITAAEFTSKFTWSPPPGESPNKLDHHLHLHLRTRLITASEYISEFTQSLYGETVELDSRQPIINTPLYLAWHPKRIHD